MKETTSPNNNVTLGQFIGRQSNVSKNSISTHLHYEVRKGNNTSLGDSSANNVNEIPYGHMVSNAQNFSMKKQFIK